MKRLILISTVLALAILGAGPVTVVRGPIRASTNGLRAMKVAYYACNDSSGGILDYYSVRSLTDANSSISQDTTNFKLDSAQTQSDTTTTNKAWIADATFNFTVPFTITGWVRPTTIDGSQRNAWAYYNEATANRSWRFAITSTSGPVFTVCPNADGTGGVGKDTGAWFSANAWHFVAMGWDGASVWISADNETRRTAALATAPATVTTQFSLFNDSEGGNVPFLGQIDEVGVWSGTLTTTQQTYLYGSGTPPDPSTFD